MTLWEMTVDFLDSQIEEDGAMLYFARLLMLAACAPILILVEVIGRDNAIGRTLGWLAVPTIAGSWVFYFWRRRIVRRRVEATGSPLVEREPY